MARHTEKVDDPCTKITLLLFVTYIIKQYTTSGCYTLMQQYKIIKKVKRVKCDCMLTYNRPSLQSYEKATSGQYHISLGCYHTFSKVKHFPEYIIMLFAST